MNVKNMVSSIIVICFIISAQSTQAQQPINWTSSQLMQPAALADAMHTGKNLPLIVCVGPGATIAGSLNAGPAHEDAGINNLKKQLGPLPRKSAIVIYCGCCPFEHCPNVRPAINLLKQMGFTNYKLLNLEHNLKTDWIDKGYPVNKN